MNSDSTQLYKTIYDTYSKLKDLIDEGHKSVQTVDLEDLADFLLAVREASRLLDENAKCLRGLLETGKKVCCLRWVNSNYNGENIKTEHVTATPKVTNMPVLPTGRKAPEDYNAFMRHFGISDDIIENDSFRPHWPGMKQQIADDAEKGKPLPPGCDPSKTYQVFDVVLRKKKGILEG